MIDKQHDLSYLDTLISDNKRELIRKVLEYRTNYVTVMLENITQPHNASAVMRTCDIFGIQNLHVVDAHKTFHPQGPIAKGANKWVSTNQYSSSKKCIDQLKKQGYSIVATVPHERGYTLSELPINTKMALCFGTEISGLSDELIELADAFVTIPMFGFTESFNISVSAAICLYDVMARLHASDIKWKLSEQEKTALKLDWYQRILHIKK